MQQFAYFIIFLVGMAFSATGQEAREWIERRSGQEGVFIVTETSVPVTGDISRLSDKELDELFERKRLSKTLREEYLVETWPLAEYVAIESMYSYRFDGTAVSREFVNFTISEPTNWWLFIIGQFVVVLMITVVVARGSGPHAVLMPLVFIALTLTIVFTVDRWMANEWPIVLWVASVIGILIYGLRIRGLHVDLKQFGIMVFIIALMTLPTLLVDETAEGFGFPSSDMHTLGGTFAWFGIAFAVGLVCRWIRSQWKNQFRPATA